MVSKEAQRGGLRRGWTVRLRADRPTEPLARQMGLTSWVCSLVVRQALKNPQNDLRADCMWRRWDAWGLAHCHSRCQGKNQVLAVSGAGVLSEQSQALFVNYVKAATGIMSGIWPDHIPLLKHPSGVLAPLDWSTRSVSSYRPLWAGPWLSLCAHLLSEPPGHMRLSTWAPLLLLPRILLLHTRGIYSLLGFRSHSGVPLADRRNQVRTTWESINKYNQTD